MRVSELCHLKLDDMWLEEEMLKVASKGNKERLIPVGKQVQRLLWRYISRFRPEPLAASSNLLFLTQNGKPLTKDRVEKIMAHYGKKAGLPHIRLYDLGHTHASLLLQAGVHPKIVQESLGHSTIRATLDTYSHVMSGLQEAAAQRFDDLLAAGGIENVGKHYQRTPRHPKSSLGAGGFEPPTT